MAILTAMNLVKKYGPRTVVDDVSFHVNPGEIVGLLGRNGAGKTTSFRITMGMISPNAGRVLFEDHDISNLPMYKRARLGIGYLAQKPSVFQRLTVYENLMAILETRPMGHKERREIAARLMEQFDLTKLRKQHAMTLSGGETRKLEIARALVTDPSLLLLDEPFSGVDPVTTEDLQEEVRRLRSERNIAVLITDHDVTHTLQVCDRVYIMHDGKVKREGRPREIINDQELRELYLGSGFRGDEFD